MTKIEAIAYLRKKQLLERLADVQIPDTQSTTEEAMREMEKPPESGEKNLTTEPTNV